MTNFRNLDWYNHDGINFPMINDVPRNDFYNHILSQEVKNKPCLDIGFGTGLLSLLALKHGAQHVVAYEKNLSRFELGQHIVKELNLTDVIDLRHGLATWQEIVDSKCEVVFHEIIHQSHWGEGVWYIRPQSPGLTYAPGILFFELYAQEISDSTVAGFFAGGDTDYFNPGVDVDPRFINIINRLILNDSSKDISSLDSEDSLIRTKWNSIHKHWSVSPEKVFRQGDKRLLASYQVDYNKCETTFSDSRGTKTSDLTVDHCQLFIDTNGWQSKNMLLQTRFGLQHNNHRLYLDACRNWGEEAPWIFVKPKSNLIFTQDFSGRQNNFNLVKS